MDYFHLLEILASLIFLVQHNTTFPWFSCYLWDFTFVCFCLVSFVHTSFVPPAFPILCFQSFLFYPNSSITSAEMILELMHLVFSLLHVFLSA